MTVKSSVGLPPMTNGVNPNRIISLIGEAYAIVADPQPQLAGLTFEFLYVALATLGETLDRSEDSHCRLSVDAADIGTRVLRPVDFLHLLLPRLFVLEIVRSETELGENFFVRNSLPAALLEPSLRLGDGLGVLPEFRVRRRREH